MSNENTIATHYIVIGDGEWAKASGLKAAFYGWMARSKPKGAVTVGVRMVDVDAAVDELGTFRAKVSKELPDIVIPKAAIDAINEIIETVEDASLTV